jgi:signal transduction histidine kinase
MHATPMRILLVEDNPGDARLLRETLREAASLAFELTHVSRLAEASEVLALGEIDVVLLDLSLPDAFGLDTVARTLEAAPKVPIIVLTGTDDEQLAMQAVRAGAQDYLVKGQVESALLTRAMRYAIQRKQQEQERAQLLHREQQARAVAEAAVRARDEVLRVVSHDLGNSLSAVMLTTTVLLRTLPQEGWAGSARQSIENIRVLTQQMHRLRQDLLDVASIEAGRLSIDVERHDPCSLLKEVREHFAPVAAEKEVELSVTLPAELPIILADRERVVQVLANLIGNAIKFTPAGGRITLSVCAMPEGVCFSVSDTGRGVPAEQLSRIFDRFVKTTLGNRSGAGLGLAISKGIVEAHGGTIWAESEEGRGSTFSFTLPAAG